MFVIGLVTGWLMGSLTDGSGPGTMVKVITGVVGSFLGGFVFSMFGERVVGEGTLYLIACGPGQRHCIYRSDYRDKKICMRRSRSGTSEAFLLR